MSDCRFGVSPVNYPDPDPDYFPPEASLSHQSTPENLTILEGKNHNQDVYKVAQREIEMVNQPW